MTVEELAVFRIECIKVPDRGAFRRRIVKRDIALIVTCFVQTLAKGPFSLREKERKRG